MCGRTACTLNPDSISRNCRYQTKDSKPKDPKWVLNKDKYTPGYNKAPQSFCPVLLGGNHFKDCRDKLEDENVCLEEGERVLSAMKWGLVPSWIQGGGNDKLSYNMNNARSDTMLEKRSYKIPLRKGQRCVVVADGFYEWKKTDSGKQPYYIYFPQPETNIENQSNTELTKAIDKENKKKSEITNDKNSNDNENKDNIIKNMLMMAGIFEKSFQDGKDLYSYTVITVDSHESFAWLHHRMPAMLESEQEVQLWLDNENVSLDKALEVIKPKDCLQWHLVSKYVNNSRNQGNECTAEVDLESLKLAEKPKPAPESKNMLKWLKSGGSPKKQDVFVKTPSSKKRKNVATMDRWVKKEKR